MPHHRLSTVRILQHNVLKWTYTRKNELSNLYLRIDPEVILLNATGMKEKDRIKLFNYNVYQRNREDENNAGVAIAIRKNIQHQILDDFLDDVLAVRMETLKGPLIIATAYRPPRRDAFPMEDVLKLLRGNTPTYIIADLNARHRCIGHTDNNETGMIINNLINNNLADHLGPDFNTRVTAGGISRPDIILKNKCGYFNYAIREGDLTTSDHIPVMVTLSTTAIVKENAGNRNSYNKIDWDRAKIKIEQEIRRKQTEIDLKNNPRNIDKSTIDNEIKDWFHLIEKALKESTPNRILTYVPHARESDLLKLLQNIYNQIQNSPNIDQQERRRIILYLQAEIKNENIKLFDEMWNNMIGKLNLNHNDPKKFWGDMKRLMGGNKEGPPTFIWGADRKKLTSTGDRLERFKVVWGDMFKISEEDNVNFDQENDRGVNQYLRENNYRIKPYHLANLNRLNENDPLTKPLTYMEMLKIITNFKNKAPGESGITRKILLNLPRSALERLNEIINLLLSMGYFAVGFKNGHMIMTQKPNKDNKEAENYRPITLLEVPGKILERTINDRFYIFLEENNKLNKHQYGFRKGYGTEAAILKIYEKIAINQKMGSQCNIVCRDVAKTFDKVWHQGLQYKILQLQLPDVTEKILCNFLEDRTAQIKLDNQLSDKFPLKSGVPQGSILPPTLYIFYTSDMPPPGAGSIDVLFADDVTQIIEHHHRSRKFLARKTEREINRINQFENLWKIKTNRNKFKLLSISLEKPEPIRIDGTIINMAQEITVLGFKLRRTGFIKHIHSRLGIANGTLTKLKRFRKLKPRIKCHLFKSLIRSALEYPNTPQCLMSETNKDKFQKFQNKVIRRYINYKAEEDEDNENTIEDLHEQYKIEPINQRMHRRAKITWNKFAQIEPEITTASIELKNDRDRRDHYWWRRMAPYVEREAPEARY